MPHEELANLVDGWLDWAGVGSELGVSVGKVRRMIREHHLAAVVLREGSGPMVPAGLLAGGQVVKGVAGTLTLLHDNRYDDAAAIRWLFTADPTLPGRPIDALRENRGAEVKRRAQALAF